MDHVTVKQIQHNRNKKRGEWARTLARISRQIQSGARNPVHTRGIGLPGWTNHHAPAAAPSQQIVCHGTSGWEVRRGLLACIVDEAGDLASQILPVYDTVDEPVFEQKFASLKSFGKILPDRVLDDAWSRKSDERIRFRKNHIPQHGETRRHTTSRRIGQD